MIVVPGAVRNDVDGGAGGLVDVFRIGGGFGWDALPQRIQMHINNPLRQSITALLQRRLRFVGRSLDALAHLLGHGVQVFL